MSLVASNYADLDFHLDIYEILNIAPDIISNDSNNVNYWLALIATSNNYHHNLTYINQIIAIIEKFHSYFHFEQSFAYTISAYTKRAAGNFGDAKHYLAKAQFQDPINKLAQNLPDQLSAVLAYDKNYQYEQEFLRFVAKEFKTTQQLKSLDRAIRYVYLGKIRDAQILLQDFSYDSHRFWLIKAISHLYDHDLLNALKCIEQVGKMLEISHQNYHQYAAGIYQLRAKTFSALGHDQVAKNDLIKARNLCPKSL